MALADDFAELSGNLPVRPQASLVNALLLVTPDLLETALRTDDLGHGLTHV